MTFGNLDRRAHPRGLYVDRWAAPDGWDHRCWNWPAPDGERVRGSMMFQAGRGDFFEKYIESLAAWHAAGWNLCGFDWRGQAGSGRLLEDATVGHAESFDPWLADLDAYAARWLGGTPGPHVLAAHSMGGHLAMRYLIDRKPAIDAVVLSAPMLKMVSRPFPERIAHFIARMFVRCGRGEVHAWPENERPSLPGSSRQKLLTHDFERYSDEDWWVRNTPDLKLGPPSWQWLVAAYESSARMFARGTFESVETPVLIVAAALDRLVSIEAIRKAAERLPDATLHVHHEASHELLRERDDIRDEVMAEIGRFLDEKAPSDR